jgi:hypothetical protein
VFEPLHENNVVWVPKKATGTRTPLTGSLMIEHLIEQLKTAETAPEIARVTVKLLPGLWCLHFSRCGAGNGTYERNGK